MNRRVPRNESGFARYAALVALLLCSYTTWAQQGNTLELMLSVDDDGSAVAVERFELAAPMHEPLHWRMPTAAVTPLGVRRLLFLDVLEISDGRGNKIQSKTREYGNALDVEVPVQPLADNIVRVTYMVRNAVRFREQHDELFWPVGAAWSAPIQEAALRFTVPEGAVGQVTAQWIRGGARSTALQPPQGKTTSGEATDPAPGAKAPVLELVFPSGILQRPGFAHRAWWFVSANPIVMFPVFLGLLAYGLRKHRLRSEGADVTVAIQYEPPEDLPPAEAGVLIDGGLDHRDLAAMLLDLARRGFLRIEPGTPDEGVPYAGPDFILRLLKPMDSWAGAYSYEHMMLFHTFYGGQWTKLSSVSLRFYAVVPVIELMVKEELRKKRLYVNPQQVGAQRTLAALLLGALLWAAQAAGWFAVAQTGMLGLVAIASVVPVVVLFTRGVSHRTAKGTHVLAELRGFQEFLETVDADRMERITPDLFERFLPYAIALGVERQWGTAFSTVSSGPPLWWQEDKATALPDFLHLVGGYAQARPPRGTHRLAAK